MSSAPTSDSELLTALEKHLEANPNDAAAWNVKGVLLAKRSEFGAALRSLDTAIRIKPDLPEAHTNRGRVLMALGPEKASEALKSFDRALELSPKNLDALVDKAAALRTLGRAEEELVCIQILCGEKPDNPVFWTRKGDLEVQLGRMSDGVSSYDRVLSIDPDSVTVLVHRAVALAILDQFKEALKSAESAAKLTPDDAGVWRVLADVNLRAERYGAAMKALERAAVLDPTDASIENTMGMVSYKSHDTKAAIIHFERAATIDKHHRLALKNMGFIYMELEEWEAAAKAWNRLTSFLKDDPAVWDAKATTHARLEDFCLAADAWENARRQYRQSGDEKEVQRVAVLGRAARINCGRQKKALKAQREHEKATRTFSDRFEMRRKKNQ